MKESARTGLEALGAGAGGCLLRRKGTSLHPEPVPPDVSVRAESVPLAAALLDELIRESGGPEAVLSDSRLLGPLRPLIGARASSAIICPVPPPSPTDAWVLYLLVWFEDPAGSASEDLRRREAAKMLAGRIPSVLGDRVRGPGAARGLQVSLDASSQGLLILRPEGETIWSNPAGDRALGIDPSLRPGDHALQRVPEPARTRLRSLMELATSGAWSSEEIEFGAEGFEPRLQHVLVDAVEYEGGPAFVVALRPLTERDRLVDLLRREKDFTRSLLEAANACVLGLDLQGRTILFNRVFQAVTGYKLADVLGRDTVEILVPEEGRADWRTAHLKALSGGTVTDQDFIIRTNTGERRTLCLSAGRISDAGGSARGVLWTGRDVTEERRRETELMTREESASRSLGQLKEFSRISSIILQEKSLDNVCKMFVEALSKVSTFRRAILTLCDENFCGYRWYFAGLSEEEQETFHRNKMTQRERVTIFQERFRLGNSYYIPHTEGWHYEGVRSQVVEGEMLDWHPDDFLFIPLYGTNRKLVGVVSVDDPHDGRRPTAESISPLELFANQVAHSIEERKLDQEVRQSTERYRTLVEAMHEGVFSVDLRERILMANAALAHLLGLSEIVLNGRSIGSMMDPEDLARFRTETALHDGGRVARFELNLRSESDELIPVQISTSPYMDEEEYRGCFAVVRDLRVEKKAEQDRKVMQEQLAQAEKLSALGELISGIAHELNNPLTGVMGYSQLLLNTNAAPDSRKNLEKIHKEALRCQKIVQNLLIFARRRAPERKAVDVNELVEATLELRANQLKVDGVEVVRDLEEHLPQITGDFHQLQQVMFNIINNAHQAMTESGNEGRLTIRTRSSGESIEISFMDTGPGIPHDRIQKIFDPFFTTKEIGKGTGLGLSLSYGIIKEHQGQIDVRSVPGQGATFIIWLPVRRESEEAPHAIRQEISMEPLEGKEILVVDDEETILDLLESVLLAAGHRVTTAANGRQALEKIKAADYDIIISDVKMPDMGGQKLYESVSEIKPWLKRRMIFSTGDTVNPTTQALFQRTGNLHIAKPFRLEEVDQVIRRVLDLERGSET
ncbi:MAG TPA: PAS domain S-box protein, partial [Candidatus Saccharimonadales bacterium]|nr:PAS domain S-box protein [Candidatus Saccharimonadales bacterium]